MDATLTIGGTRWGGWKSASIRRGIEQGAGSFRFTVSDAWPGGGPRRRINPGDAVTVQVGEITVITGYVDDVVPSLDGRRRELEISGRDATGDLVDCSATASEYQGRSLLQMAQAVCGPFGIPVAAAPGLTFDPVAKFKVDAGETGWEVIERLCRISGVLAVADGQGGLLLTRASTTRVATALVEGQNVLAAQVAASWRERFSKITVTGIQPGSDDGWGAATGAKATATDPRVTRYRPLVIPAEDSITKADAKVRAEWEASVRYGRALPLSVTVPGWDESDGIWQPNRRVRVQIPGIDVVGEMLISAVTFDLDDKNGRTTTLELMRPEAFDRVPIPEPDDSAGGWA